MASVTFPPALGGDGSTVTDDANTSTGLANGGHRTRFVAALAQAVAVMSGAVSQAAASAAAALASKNNAATSEANAATSATTALNAPGTQATSSTTIAVATGSVSLTLGQTGKAFVVGQWVAITDTGTPGRWLAGQITAFNAGTGAMTVAVIQANGTGSASSWAVVPTPPVATIVPTQWAGVDVGSLV